MLSVLIRVCMLRVLIVHMLSLRMLSELDNGMLSVLIRNFSMGRF